MRDLAWFRILEVVAGTGEGDEGGLFAIGESQAGAVAHHQLRAAGLTVKEVRALLRRGVLRTTAARGVYRISGAEVTPNQDLWVALLAGPDGTLASHLSAAALRGLLAPPAVPHVTVPRWANGKFGGAVIHHAQVGPADRGATGGIDTTTLPRTIVDCASVLSQSALNTLVDGALGKGLCSYGKVKEAWGRAGHVRGGALLEAALAPYTGGAEPGSVKAAHVLRRIHDWGFPMPVCERKVNDVHGEFIAKVDFVWPDWWLILEYDGEENHGPRRWRNDDGVEDQLQAVGFRVERADRFDLRPSATRLHDLLAEVLLQPPRGPWPPGSSSRRPRAA